jgi:DNA repair protein RadC
MASDDEIIAQALRILLGRLQDPGVSLSSPGAVKDFLRLKISEYDHEVFAVLYLDVKNRLIAYEELFRGTLTHTSVYPREIVKNALKHNAASVIFSHNHPSGSVSPSEADLRLTSALRTALSTVDIRTLDHIVVAGSLTHSFAEHGEL